MDRIPLTPFEIAGKVDCLRAKEPPKRDIDYDNLKQGEEFFLRMTCPGCGHSVLGRKEEDFQCQYCYLLFRYKKVT